MHKIDCCKWGEFQIKDIFVTENKKQVLTGASISRSALVEGETPRISATNINNGIVVLQSKMGMSWGCKFFITIMVFKEAQMFYKAFEDELNRHIKTDF